MTPSDDWEQGMERFAIDNDTVERLLNGVLDPEDAPHRFGEVVALLQAAALPSSGAMDGEAAAVGAEAVIVPDLPDDEAVQLREAADAAGLALILLVAPTTTAARLEAACRRATGFVYCVGVTGTTGARAHISQEALDLLMRVKAVTSLPRALGFGLSRHEHIRALRGRAEAAVVGAALIDRIGAAPRRPVEAAESFLVEMLGTAR